MSLNYSKSTDQGFLEVSPGRLERPFKAPLTFFNPLLGWSVWSSIKLGNIPHSSNSPEDLIHRARLAWMRATYEQPHLASTYDYETLTTSYTILNDQLLASWLAQSFVVLGTESEDPRTANVCREKSTLCINPYTREMVLRTPHQYTDGTGTILLLSDIVTYIAHPQHTTFGDEHKNLAPLYDLAAGVPVPNANDLKRAGKLAKSFLTNQPSIGIPCIDDFSYLGTPQHSISGICLSDARSKEVVKACKVRGFTVTHAAHAAKIQATAEMDSTSPASGYYTALKAFNWRSRVRPEYQRYLGAFYISAFPIVIESPLTKDFDSLATLVKQSYTHVSTDKSLDSVLSPMFAEMIAAMNSVQNPPPANTATPAMSSLGIIENHLPKVVEGIEIADFKFGLDTNGTFLTLYLWNWDGKINFHMSWDSRCYNKGQIDQFLGLVVKKLEEGLDL